MASRGGSTEDISGWLTPRKALDILEAVFPSKHIAVSELTERLRGGMVVAMCHYTTIDNGVRFKQGVNNRIGAEDWERVYSDNDVWVTGTLTIPGGYRGLAYESSQTIRFFDVRFNPTHISEILALHQPEPSIRPGALPKQPERPASNSQPEEKLPPSNLVERKINLGGAPKKDWWDDFWIEICRQIWEDGKVPQTQADLERSMLDWASEHGYDMSESTAKTAARKLFRAWKLGDKN